MAIRDVAKQRVQQAGIQIKNTGGSMDQFGPRTRTLLKQGVQDANDEQNEITNETGQTRNTSYVKGRNPK